MLFLPPGGLEAQAAPRAQLEGQAASAGPVTLREVSGAGPDDAWIVGDGGVIYRTRNGGATWLPQDSGTREDLLSVCAVDASTAWAAGRRGTILLTTDGGITWQALGPGMGRDIYDISAAASWPLGSAGTESVRSTGSTGISQGGTSTVWAVADGPIVLRTTDGGLTWEQRDPGNLSALFSIAATGPESALAAGENGTVLTTGDGGLNWTLQATNTGDHLVDLCVTTAAGTASTGIASDGSAAAEVPEAGTTVPGTEAASPEADAAAPEAGIITPEEGYPAGTTAPPAVWALGETGTVITSADGGITWSAENIETPATLSAICAVGVSTAWFAGRGGLMRRTADGGATWDPQVTGTPNTVRSIYAADAENVWAVGENAAVLRTYDGGNTWLPQYIGDGRTLNDVCSSGGASAADPEADQVGPGPYPAAAAFFPDTAWAAGEGGAALRTANGGFTWTPVYPGTSKDLHGVASPDPSSAWLVGQDGTILRTRDGGKSWEEQPSRASYDLYDVSCVDAKIAWAVGRRGTIVRTFDEGYTWYRQDYGDAARDSEPSDPARDSGDPVRPADLFGVYAASAATAYSVGRGGMIMKTVDAGETWTVQESGTASDLLSVSGSGEDHAWVCGRDGTVLRTGDGGRTWVPVDAGTAANLNAVSVEGVLAVGSDEDRGPNLDIGPQAVWLTGEGGFVAHTQDGGRTWTAVDTGTEKGLNGIAAPGGGTAYAVGARGSILHYRSSPRLDAVSPSTAQAGGTVTLSGLAFGEGGPGSSVSFGAVRAEEYTHWSDRLIKVALPRGASLREEITVITPQGTSASFLLIILPKLDGASPRYARAGKPLTISGASFGPAQADSYVTMGSVKVTEVEYWTNNLIRFNVPGNAPENAEVKVVTASGTSNPVTVRVSRTPPPLPDLIKPRIDFLDPTTAMTGEEVAIYGSGFGPSRGSSYVSFGSVRAAEYTSWANDRIIARVPAGVYGQVKVAVTTPAATSNAVSFNAVMPPGVLSITPASGPAGTQVEITGAGFGPREGPTNYASFNGVQPPVYDYWSEGRIVAKVPLELTGAVAVTVTTPLGTSNQVTFYVRKPDLRGVDAAGVTVWSVGEHGTIMRSGDGGSAWTAQDSGTTMWLYGVAAGSASVAWAVGEGGVILGTADGGANWERHPTGAINTLYGVDAVDAATAWAVGGGGTILKTMNGGAVWTQQASGTGASLYAVSAVDAEVAWAVGAGGVVLKTVDGGASWSPQNSRVTASFYGVSAVTGSVCWAVGAGGIILRTDNGGLTWTHQGAADTAMASAVDAGVEGAAPVPSGSSGDGDAPGPAGNTEGDRAGSAGDGFGGDSARAVTDSPLPASRDGVDGNGATLAASDPGTGRVNGLSDEASATHSSAAITPGIANMTTGVLRAVYAVSPLTAWVVGDGGVVLKTVDGGLSWTASGGVSSSLYGVTAVGASAVAVGNNSTTRVLP